MPLCATRNRFNCVRDRNIMARTSRLVAEGGGAYDQVRPAAVRIGEVEAERTRPHRPLVEDLHDLHVAGRARTERHAGADEVTALYRVIHRHLRESRKRLHRGVKARTAEEA